jgi:ABC-type branched-subunit amino acid transport system substrate-binding protein
MTRPMPLWRTLAVLAAGTLVLAACADDKKEPTPAASAPASAAGSASASASAKPLVKVEADGTLHIGTILPQTGSLAFLGPPEFAGVKLAVQEINKAGGVLGKDVKLTEGDSGDATTDIANQTVDRLLAAKADAIIGAASSGVSLTVIDKIVGSGVVQFSPANTSKKLSTYDDKGLYFRTAPSDILQGQILGEIIVEDKNDTVGILALQDPYGEGLAEDLKKTIEEGGSKVVETVIYDPTASSFDTEVEKIKAKDPDAVVVIGFEESNKILSTMIEKGIGPKDKKVYGTDGNMGNALGEQFKKTPGALKGMKGTTPLSQLSKDFEGKLKKVNSKLKDFNYAGESYDAVVVVALAAEVAKSDAGTDIGKEIIGVTKDGEKCKSFADCVKLIKDGKDIDYDGVSGPIEFDDVGDPGQASYGILEFQADNTLKTLEFRLAGK